MSIGLNVKVLKNKNLIMPEIISIKVMCREQRSFFPTWIIKFPFLSNAKYYTLTLILQITMLLGGCSAPIEDIQIPEENYIIIEENNLSNAEFVKKELYSQYQEWKGTRYRMGGLNKRGIDCSGFVYITFKYKFGIILPRTTEEMAKLGKNIEIGDWRAGDLVFFKTGLFDKHVGIYIDEGNFLHASTSQGVIVSQLNNPYWHNTYWMTKRI